MASPCQLFVYGTLKPGERAFADFCQPFAIATQSAQVRGRIYHLPLGYPAMTLEPGWVQGVLLTLSSSEPLSHLDAFEEYYPDRPAASAYQRQRHPIYDSAHNPLGWAWIYTMERDRVVALGGQWLPGGDWTESQP
jgi:gamma-glutamylcyclotransferase (GGCT)/AIG2-like uncharacterized protein YtfP